MNRRMLRRLATIAGSGLVTMMLGCGDVSHNDFGQSLSFDGFFAEAPCSTGLAMATVFTELPEDGGDANCTLGSSCVVAVRVTNQTTGRPIPTSGGQGSTGSPVPTTDGVRIFPRNLHVEYSLPSGEIPARDYVMSGKLEPRTATTGGGTAPAASQDCREFLLFTAADTVAIVQDPLSYPALPFLVRARVTYEGVTEGGLSIKTHGDLDIQVF